MDHDEILEEQEKQAFVQHLIDSDALDGAARGVALQFADRGYDSLSEKQQFVLDTHVLAVHRVTECERCSGDIPWSEQLAALDNGGYCSWCDHMMSKAD